MVKIALSIILFLLASIGFTQENQISGTIKNVETHANLAYVSIGVIDKAMGTISKEDGTFLMKTNKYLTEKNKVRFSMIGYQDYVASVKELENNPTIYLIPESSVLPEIAIIKKHINRYKIGNTKVGKMLMKYYSIHDASKDDQLGVEQGMIFDVENDFVVDKFSFHIGCNEYQNVKLRLKFYDVDKGEPIKLFNREDIIFDITDRKKGIFTVDLQDYDIIIKDKKQIAVSLEWVDGLVEGKHQNVLELHIKPESINTEYLSVQVNFRGEN
ncbi:carboxypeptidase-like regulatory domain-containing protein [Myroides indicus]|uniref:Carboxypeptidase-like protein n=1 Tax=Myroides indicus TaxID=1323422 RepID=A0A4V3E8P3_9FLAO|nr:carboxypeptidase-like regulatory domain-containing protein [Myroides indicus]TDS60189.1 carboxypeptidase-like protein [Myroides indicus]